MSYIDDTHFEDEVRRIARARWPEAQYSGASIINGRERDGVFETDDVIHYVEATTSKRADKAKYDTKKIFELMSQQQKSGSMKGSIGWFVTKDEPTAEQREEVKRHGKQQIKALSFSQFQQALVDVPGYISARANHFFGSIKDPTTGEINARIEYVPLDLVNIESDTIHDINSITEGLRRGESYSLLGDYGAGKSMTLRQIYFSLTEKYKTSETPLFPLYINLREHSGQDDPTEVIERHARRIGFEKSHTLVNAWRAGFVIPILDGFDEITSLGITASRNKMREARRRSLEAIRKLIEQTPTSVGIVIAGREHFFNNKEERFGSLKLRKNTIDLNLNEFTSKQIQRYLKNNHRDGKQKIPTWMPTRPLLVGYIVSRGLLDSLPEDELNLDHIDGWDYLLDKIFEREANISPNLDGDTLRKILERLATISRGTPDGIGPITQKQIRDAYIDICETEPDEQATVILQRLPGLGVYRNEEDSRVFVDSELSGVCRARDIADFILNPYDCLNDQQWRDAISLASTCAGNDAITKVCRTLRHLKIDLKITFEQLILVLNKTSGLNALKADAAAVLCSLPHSPSQTLIIEEGIYDGVELLFENVGCNLNHLTFKNCFFSLLNIDTQCDSSSLPIFDGCAILKIRGRASEKDLPLFNFRDGTEIEEFTESAETQSSILSLNGLSKGEKVMLSILRKLFIQSLGGRAESALTRGLELNDRQLVPDILKLLQQHDLINIVYKSDGVIIVPVRKELHRIRSILMAPNTSDDDLLISAKKIN
ncbi:TPA: NACHT domain-containing protein [Klebsiella variicola subsp. variicola]|nr:NACHT domain-containing protein [Klebsiella variicola subsp. variicola]